MDILIMISTCSMKAGIYNSKLNIFKIISSSVIDDWDPTFVSWQLFLALMVGSVSEIYTSFSINVLFLRI